MSCEELFEGLLMLGMLIVLVCIVVVVVEVVDNVIENQHQADELKNNFCPDYIILNAEHYCPQKNETLKKFNCSTGKCYYFEGVD